MERLSLKNDIKEAQHGSAEAFGRLYAVLAPELYRFALWYLSNEADAEDAVQDACLNAYANIRALKKEAAFRSWFFKILANICRDKLAVPARGGNILSIDDPEAFFDPADAQSACFVTDLEMRELIAALGEPDASIVLLSAAAGFNSKEIGSLLKLNSATVRSRLSRALAKLREQLTEKEECNP